ncbi:MAG: DUF3368 domain-containing protein [bacterium]|nr:DUF3368 domain-containing protein [bacterium]
MPECVISNTSPLFYLHQIGHLALLQRLYEQIIVPEAVVQELEAGRQQGESVPDIQEFPWMEVRLTRIPALVRLITDLGPGEAQVLALALEIPNSLSILDDRLAREIAQLQKLRITGTAGVLLKAKQRGFLPEIASLLKKFSLAGFRLSEHVNAQILKLAGE